MGDFGGAIVATAPKVAARTASAMGAVHDALGAAALGVSSTVSVGVGAVRSATARAAVGASAVAGGGTVIHVHGDVGVKADDADEFMQSFLAAIGDMVRLGDA